MHTENRVRDLRATPAFATLSGLPAAALCFQTVAAPRPAHPPATSPWRRIARSTDPGARVPPHQSPLLARGRRKILALSPQRPATSTSCSRSWLSLPFELQDASDHPRNSFPVLRLHRQLLFPSLRDRVKFRLPVVVRRSPLCRDPTLLLQPQQRRVHRPLIQLQHFPAN